MSSGIPRDPNSIHGFLFEVVKDEKTHGYLFAVEHAADEEMLLFLENSKIKSIFDQSLHYYLENHKRFIKNIDEISQNRGIEHYSENIRRIKENPEKFYSKIEQVPPIDIKLKRVLPGVDYHVIKNVYEKKGKDYENHLHSLENENADQQKEADESTIKQFESNLDDFLKDHPEVKKEDLINPVTLSQESREFHEKVLKNLDKKENLKILKKVVKDKNEAWKNGDEKKFLETMRKLDGDFFANSHNTKTIAYQRNREVDLARKVDELLLSSGSEKNVYIFGVQHLLSTDKITVRSLLEAKGWTIRQI